MRVVILGAGTMAAQLAGSIERGDAGSVEVVGIAGSPRFEMRTAGLAARLGCVQAKGALDLADLQPDLLIEVASPAAVRDYSVAFLDRGIDLLLMSIGALVDPCLYEQVSATARRRGRRVHLPSGAIGGLDVLRAARVQGLEDVTLITSKPPAALIGAPFFVECPIDLGAITVRTIIFTGSASEAVRLFPANVNVAALVSLAGIGSQNTTTQIVVDPTLERNVHEVIARGSFGELRLQLINVPSEMNPKTSQLACLSLVATLRRLTEPIEVGF